METNAVIWPTALPAPLIGRRHQILPRGDSMRMETKRVRVRRAFPDPMELLDVTWHFTADQFEVFEEFFHTSLENGSIPFVLETVEVDPSATTTDPMLVSRTLGFIDADYSFSHSDNLYAVSATLDLTEYASEPIPETGSGDTTETGTAAAETGADESGIDSMAVDSFVDSGVIESSGIMESSGAESGGGGGWDGIEWTFNSSYFVGGVSCSHTLVGPGGDISITWYDDQIFDPDCGGDPEIPGSGVPVLLNTWEYGFKTCRQIGPFETDVTIQVTIGWDIPIGSGIGIGLVYLAVVFLDDTNPCATDPSSWNYTYQDPKLVPLGGAGSDCRSTWLHGSVTSGVLPMGEIIYLHIKGAGYFSRGAWCVSTPHPGNGAMDIDVQIVPDGGSPTYGPYAMPIQDPDHEARICI